LSEILSALEMIARELELYWPVHPRTRANLERNGLTISPLIHLTEPMGYLDFLWMEANSSVVLTDSGGIQEETTVLGVPCLTLRQNTERPATLIYGTNHLAGTNKETILAAWRNAAAENARTRTVPPLWDGQAGIRCHAILRNRFLMT